MSKLKAEVKYIMDSKPVGNSGNYEIITTIYFISDREIKPGDLCFNSFDNRIWEYQPIPCTMPYWGNLDTLKKLEASSNKHLDVPLIPQSFINKFNETYTTNLITEVKLDYFFNDSKGYVIHYDKRINSLRYSKTGEIYTGKVDLNKVHLMLKANGSINRYVIVSKAQKKTIFTLKEVQILCSKAHTLGRENVLASQKQGKYIDSFNEWFVEQID